MNKIGQWVDPNKYLPVPYKTVLIKLNRQRYDYKVASLESHAEDIRFLSELEGDGSYAIEDVEAWCYLQLDEVDEDYFKEL